MSKKTDLRRTKQRRHLLDILTSKKEPMTADQILKNCKLWCPNMALTTVYRNLDRMVQLGYLIRLESSQGAARYCAADAGNSIRLICRACGARETIDGIDLKLLETYIFDNNGFDIQQSNIEFIGVCRKCRRNLP